MKHEEFLQLWNNVTDAGMVISTETITGWENGTGYLNGGVKADLPCEIGQSMAGMDRYMRRVIAHKTSMGNYVAFERYTDGSRGILVQNAPLVIRQLVGTAMEIPIFIFDDGMAYFTLGRRVQALLDCVNNPDGHIDID
jgi:hypothetical protein